MIIHAFAVDAACDHCGIMLSEVIQEQDAERHAQEIVEQWREPIQEYRLQIYDDTWKKLIANIAAALDAQEKEIARLTSQNDHFRDVLASNDSLRQQLVDAKLKLEQESLIATMPGRRCVRPDHNGGDGRLPYGYMCGGCAFELAQDEARAAKRATWEKAIKVIAGVPGVPSGFFGGALTELRRAQQADLGEEEGT